ncbi:hypothetical protein ACFV4P_21955 [Kitasatospora sp. NPDC059795]|uniref:hypothetical protein n=1 Tax=Kitasatospora sp. NPDC059795 TaxID=3346949 RepID=UPI0036483A74
MVHILREGLDLFSTKGASFPTECLSVGGGLLEGEHARHVRYVRQKQAADEALAKAKQAREELISKIVDVVGDLIGFNDARDCFTKGDVMGCINTALNFVPWAKVFKAVKVGIKAFKLWREGEKAYTAIRSAERVAKEAEEALSVARKTEKEAAEAEAQAAKKAESDAAKKAEEDASTPTEVDTAKVDNAGTSKATSSGGSEAADGGSSDLPKYGPYHRRASPTQTQAHTQAVVDSGELWGHTGRYDVVPTVHAHAGPLPDGYEGFEFYTDVPPNRGSHPSRPNWDLGNPGVEPREGGEAAGIPIVITRVLHGGIDIG